MVLLLISVVFVPLVGELYREFALPSISVDLVPRVGGFGHQNFFQDQMGTNKGLSGPATLKLEGNLIAIQCMSSASLLARAVGSGAVVQTLVPRAETAI